MSAPSVRVGAWEHSPGLPLSRCDLRAPEGYFHPLLWSVRLSLLSEEVIGTGRTQKLTPRLSRPTYCLSLQALPIPTGFSLQGPSPSASSVPTSDTAHNQVPPTELAFPGSLASARDFHEELRAAQLLSPAVLLWWGVVRASREVSGGHTLAGSILGQPCMTPRARQGPGGPTFPPGSSLISTEVSQCFLSSVSP